MTPSRVFCHALEKWTKSPKLALISNVNVKKHQRRKFLFLAVLVQNSNLFIFLSLYKCIKNDPVSSILVRPEKMNETVKIGSNF